MDTESLEKFCEEKGLKIARELLGEYDSVDFEINSREIEEEIYQISMSYSRILFFEEGELLQETARKEVKNHLSSRFDQKQIQKMKDIELIAHWIKLDAIERLKDNDIFLL